MSSVVSKLCVLSMFTELDASVLQVTRVALM